MRRTILALLIALMLTATVSLEAYIIVLKNGRKIYSAKPFELKEDGVYFTLPNDMLILIKRDDIDFKATQDINKRKASTPSATPTVKKPTVEETAKTSGSSDQVSPIATAPSPATNEPPKSSQGEIQTQPQKQTGEIVKSKAETSRQSPKPKAEPKKPDFGIPVETIDKSTITLDGLIEMARKVEWIYEGKCPICGGTGKSSLSTGSVELVCTYCNGTGKGGKWNDELLKIGDDCPWCILGYDELSKGPCKNCLGTGRYLGLDKLPIFEIYENKGDTPGSANNISNINSKGIRK
jgi:hypothetical protein